MHLYAFIAILVPKLVATVTPLCPLCTGVSQMYSLMAQTLSQNQTLHGHVSYNWSYGHFCDFFWLILAKIWLPWQRPLDPCTQKCLVWIGRAQKPPVISNHILVISRRNALICIYSNLVPKLVAMVTPHCQLSTGVSQINSSIAHTLSQNQTLHRHVAYNWSYGHFCDFFGLFWPKFGCHSNVP